MVTTASKIFFLYRGSDMTKIMLGYYRSIADARKKMLEVLTKEGFYLGKGPFITNEWLLSNYLVIDYGRSSDYFYIQEITCGGSEEND